MKPSFFRKNFLFVHWSGGSFWLWQLAALWNFVENYYKDLQLPVLSPVTEVKKAYKELAKKYHPDKNLMKILQKNISGRLQNAGEIIYTCKK
ncbi:MAG: hypothetical protein CMH78_06100 [Nitrospinae bacterium]|nr:hypothetical protein [Nitrospinota bacterium]